MKSTDDRQGWLESNKRVAQWTVKREQYVGVGERENASIKRGETSRGVQQQDVVEEEQVITEESVWWGREVCCYL